MAAAATIFGVILGTFAGLGVYRAVNGADTCASYKTVRSPFGVREVCVSVSDRPYVLVGIAASVVLCQLWMWWMLRDG